MCLFAYLQFEIDFDEETKETKTKISIYLIIIDAVHVQFTNFIFLQNIFARFRFAFGE